MAAIELGLLTGVLVAKAALPNRLLSSVDLPDLIGPTTARTYIGSVSVASQRSVSVSSTTPVPSCATRVRAGDSSSWVYEWSLMDARRTQRSEALWAGNSRRRTVKIVPAGGFINMPHD